MTYKILMRMSSLYMHQHVRSFSYYITTPIFYVNSSPHIGHLHTLLTADALNIYHRLKYGSDNTIFSTGTDEHGIKIQTAAEAAGIPYKKFCDLNSEKFDKLNKHFNTTVTDFIRTTDNRHIEAVENVWNELDSRGYIYKGSYAGWYCVSEELFVPDSMVTKKEIDGQEIHVDHNDNKLIWSCEENYMFRMDIVKEKVVKWLKDDKPIMPELFNDEAMKMISNTKDISISRPRNRLQWGISVPGDSNQTIYVWLDALTNYLTAVGYPRSEVDLRRWPIDCQVIGKDILRFHAIYWPAFLTALSMTLPRKLICHSHWLVDSSKISKSKGNIVDPMQEDLILTNDGLRYYLLRCSTTHSDNDFDRTQAIRRVNAELADTLGNLINRCCSTIINQRQVVNRALVKGANDDKIHSLLEQLDSLTTECSRHFESANFYKGVDQIMSVLRYNNTLYEEYKPWQLVKEIQTNHNCFCLHNNIQAVTFETLRICLILLQPIIPKLAKEALGWMGSSTNSLWRDARVSIGYGSSSGNSSETKLLKNPESVLFRRIKA